MKKILMAFAFAFAILASSVYAVDMKYIPENSKLVLSFSLDNISKKANLGTQELLNDFILGKIASNFLEYRDDSRVANTMTNAITNLLDFSKISRFIALDNFDSFAVMFDISNITNVDMTMIRIASQEDKLLSVANCGCYRYIILDDNTLLAWNDQVFAMALKKKNNNNFGYYETTTGDTNGIINIANNIFTNGAFLGSDTFIELEKDNSDISAWVDMDFISSFFYKILVGSYDDNEDNFNVIMKEVYSNSSLTAKLNLNDGNIDLILDSYTPNIPYDQMKLKKELDKKAYEFVVPEYNLGFLSLAFNSNELSDILKKMIGGSDIEEKFNEELRKSNSEIKDLYEFINLLGGDIFASVWRNEDYDPSYLVSISVSDEKKTTLLLSDFLVDKGISTNDGVLYGDGVDIQIYVKNDIVHIGNEDSISSVIAGKVPEGLDKSKVDLASKNMFALYVDFDVLSEFYSRISGYTSNFQSLYVTSNPIDKIHSEIRANIELKDKSKNSLEVLYSIFYDIF